MNLPGHLGHLITTPFDVTTMTQDPVTNMYKGVLLGKQSMFITPNLGKFIICLRPKDSNQMAQITRSVLAHFTTNPHF